MAVRADYRSYGGQEGQQRLPLPIGLAVFGALLAFFASLGGWAIQGVHDTQVEQGQHLAVVGAKIDGMNKSVDQMSAVMEQMRSRQINVSDFQRLEASIARELAEQSERLKSIEQRVLKLETRR